MNREHAETHLRLLAEEELRRAATRPAGSASGSRPEDEAVPSASGHLARVDKVARALTAVSALDAEVADQLLEDFGLALGARQAGSRGRRGAGLGSWMRSPAVGPWAAAPRSGTETAAGLAHAPGPAGPGATPGRVVRLGQVIPVRGEDVSGEVYLLSYAQRSSGPQFSLFARARPQAGPPGPRHPGPAVLSAARSGPSPFQQWPGVAGLEQFTATDDRETRYLMRIRDLGGGPDGWTLIMQPDPPYDPQWLDLTTSPGEPPVRIDLNPPGRPPRGATVTASAATASPGEHLLHAVAAQLLAALLPVPDGTPLPGPGGLGDVIAALQVAGALPPSSPVPGQLAALCTSLNLSGHGITAPPARDLPEPWLSMLAYYHRRKTGAALARDGCVAAALALPELDGIKLAILGLHNSEDRTVVHMHASGPMCHMSYAPDELYYWPTMWIRDNGGRWHTTRTRGRSGINGEMALRLEVVPPLSRATTWIEVRAAGQSAEARATLPLCWE